MNPLQPLLNRRSYTVSKLGHPGPSEDELKNLFNLVMTTPDHGNVKPWRFIVARGDNMKKLGELTLELYKRHSENGVASEKAIRAAKDIAAVPMMIMVVTHLDTEHKVSLWDQRLSGGAAAQNIMTGLHLLGYSGLWYTFLAKDEMKPMFGMGPEDQVVGAIAVGTPIAEFVKEIKRQCPERYCFEWEGFGVTPTPLFNK